MRTELGTRSMPLPARRVFRLGFTVALAVAVAYAVNRPLPYLAPIFAFILTAKPSPPMPLKGLIGLLILVVFTAGLGLLLVPVLTDYRVVGLIAILLGLYLGNDLSINRGKGPVGSFLTVGLTLITAAGVASFSAATTVVDALLFGIVVGVICQRLVYPFFPEDAVGVPPAPQAPADRASSAWMAIRATLIVFPAYWLGLVNPGLYLPIIMKATALGQQATELHTRNAGRELLLSTAAGGWFAILLWFGLKIHPTLWMFFLWALLFSIYFAAKLYRVLGTGMPPSFWSNVVITTLILLGPAVADTASGKDPYKASAVRLSLFVLVSLYAWAAVIVLEQLRAWRGRSRSAVASPGEVSSC